MVFPWFSYAFADEITKTIASMALKTSPRVALSTAATRGGVGLQTETTEEGHATGLSSLPARYPGDSW